MIRRVSYASSVPSVRSGTYDRLDRSRAWARIVLALWGAAWQLPGTCGL